MPLPTYSKVTTRFRVAVSAIMKPGWTLFPAVSQTTGSTEKSVGSWTAGASVCTEMVDWVSGVAQAVKKAKVNASESLRSTGDLLSRGARAASCREPLCSGGLRPPALPF